jgi:hypothetical protein
VADIAWNCEEYCLTYLADSLFINLWFTDREIRISSKHELIHISYYRNSQAFISHECNKQIQLSYSNPTKAFQQILSIQITLEEGLGYLSEMNKQTN